MRSIHTLAYAAVLALSIFTIQPTPANAEEARGNFTLSHEVRCQEIVLHPGNYTFSIKTVGSFELLTLRRVDSGATGMLLVNDVERPAPDEASRLVLVSRDGKSFLSSMELPQFDMSLRFAVPRQNALK
jgi:hypothetical protein